MPDSARLKVVIAGGGTGGHLYPGIALAQQFEKLWQAEVLFIGTSYGIENKVLSEMHYKFKKVWIRGLQRSLSLTNLLFPLRLIVSLIQTMVVYLNFKPQVVIGTGGYVSGPALIAGILFGIPTAIQEQNSYPGLVNRLLGKYVSQVHLTYEDSIKYFRSRDKTFISGNPIRGEFENPNKSAAFKKFNLSENKTTLFVFGGSQGAKAINQAVLNCISDLVNMHDLQILWATGKNGWNYISAKCNEFANNISLHEYITDMASAYTVADFVVCRSGASALAEIAIFALPAILVPYPFAAAGHQEFNARSVEKTGAAIVINEHDLNKQTLLSAINELLRDRAKRQKMSAASLTLAKPKAAEDIAKKIYSLVENKT